MKDFILWLVHVFYRDASTETHLTPSEDEARLVYESAKLKGATVAIAKVTEIHVGWDE